MKTCYLHVGFHKTASTSFQQVCGNNREQLNKAGFYYPKFAYPAQKGNIWNHTGPVSSIYKSGQVKNHSKNRNKDTEKRIRPINNQRLYEAFQQDNHLLLSGEGLSCLPRDAYLRLIDDLGLFGYNIQVLALVRSPYSFACSAIQETIKGGRYNRLIGLNHSHKVKPGTPKALPNRTEAIATLKGVFGSSIQFQPYSVALAHPNGPVGYCFEQFGIDTSNFAASNGTIVHNQSLNNLQTRALNLINREGRRQTGKKKFKKRELLLIRKGLEDLNSERFLLTEQEFVRIANQYEQMLHELEGLLGSSFTTEELRFSTPVTDLSQVLTAIARCSALLANNVSNREKRIKR